MSSHPDEVARMLRFAGAVNAAMPSLATQLPALLRPRCTEISELARELHDRAGHRISIGVVGEFATGKSLLLSVLIGDPGLLSVSNVPTTGNVTAIRLNPVPAGGVPGPVARSVSYLSAPAVAEMVGYLLDRIVRLVVDNELPYPVGQLRDHEPLREGWSRFDHFGRTVWPDRALNARIRSGVAELARIRDALVVGRDLLPERMPGAALPLDSSTTKAAVEIGRRRQLPKDFPELEPGFPARPDSALDAELLLRTQPLIHRVTLDVDVPADQWDLHDLPAQTGVELLDFPGLNSAGGGRDRFLALRELRWITGLLVAVAADHPETDEVLEFATFLERARASREQLTRSILVTATKFDAMPVAEGDLQGWSDDFASVHRITDLLTGDQPALTTYTSAVAALAQRGLPHPAAVPDVDRAALAAGRSHWGRVADALDRSPVADPATVSALRDYAHDGGLDRLRRSLATHVVQHGLVVHRTEMRAVEDRIREQLSALQRSISPLPGGGETTARTAVARLTAELSAAVQTVRTELGALRHIGLLRLPGGGHVATAHVATALCDSVAADVHAWDEWPRLIRSAGPDFCIPQARRATTGGRQPSPFPDAGNGGLDDDDLFGPGRFDADASDDRVPDTTTVLLEPFERSLHHACAEVDRLLTGSVQHWVAQAVRAAGPLADLMADEEVTTLLVAETPGGQQQGRTRLAYLKHLTTFGFVTSRLTKVLAELPEPEPTSMFPLKVDRALPWHAEAGGTEDFLRHQSVVFRMRRDIVRTITEYAQRRTAAALLDLTDRLAENLARIEGAIPSRTRRGRDTLTGAGDGPASAAEAALRELLELDKPETETGEDPS
ncbi:MAG: hypothetical protein ACRDRP_02685 [Pseudonocardiaceae bacterium]